ncbi:FadR family transcriptional regulator [Bifidobacterium pullorum subsp. saeculare]|uniref:FadR family transcriptional regulator n=1 Tax=Bifidobacterium pullorum subsp. saeculare TaxID=78257 RepID=A0A938WWD0_9BIFI|nr:FCD domain-containing protein [Bifidobacterium pullorum]MBM6698788.1 FadR family transcriptional regulator [Bifidobacterium pullorum subsp. saeculare]
MTTDLQTPGTGHMHEPVAERLALDIIDGRWLPDSPRTLEDIQSEFGVSRTVAREASRQLESARAIEIRRRVGLIPRSPDQWQALSPQVISWKLHSTQRRQELLSLTELRLCIEPMAARLAASRAPLESKAKLPVLALEMRRDGTEGRLAAFHDADIVFHTLILRSCGNELFAAFSDTVATVLRGRVEIDMYPRRPNPEALDAHVAVAEAIWTGDADRAASAMQAIVDEVGTAISRP